MIPLSLLFNKNDLREVGHVVSLKVSVDPRLRETLRRVWLKDGAPVDLSDSRVTEEEANLTIHQADKEDEGLYECQAITEYDQTTATGRLSVLNEAPTFTSIPNNIRKCVSITAKLLHYEYISQRLTV